MTQPALLASILFGLDGSCGEYCGQGWAPPELSHRWSIGPASDLLFGRLPRFPAYAAVFRATAFGGPQRVGLSANGAALCEAQVGSDSCFGCVVPGQLLTDRGALTIRLTQPDARTARAVLQVDDDRPLGLAMLSATIVGIDAAAAPARDTTDPGGLKVRELMLLFENLGDNCEFGIVQRRCDAEPLGLYRFAATRIGDVTAGIRHELRPIDDEQQLELLPMPAADGRREYVVHHRGLNLKYHSGVFEGHAEPRTLLAREHKKLRFLRGKFLEDLAEARKIYVVKRNSPLEPAEIAALHQALRQHGRDNRLLCVFPGDAEHESGSVVAAGDGLLHGYLDRFAPYSAATEVDTQSWITLCRNALRVAAAAPQRAAAQPASS